MHTASLSLLFLLVSVSGVLLAEAALSQADIDVILSLHNAERTHFHIAPLQWDAALQTVAQTYADQCQWAHNSNRKSMYLAAGGTLKSVGENIALMSAPRQRSPVTQPIYTPQVQSMVNLWVGEKEYWRSPNTCEARQVCGHYTQMIWSTTSKIGCGLALCKSTGGINNALFLLICHTEKSRDCYRHLTPVRPGFIYGGLRDVEIKRGAFFTKVNVRNVPGTLNIVDGELESNYQPGFAKSCYHLSTGKINVPALNKTYIIDQTDLCLD